MAQSNNLETLSGKEARDTMIGELSLLVDWPGWRYHLPIAEHWKKRGVAEQDIRKAWNLWVGLRHPDLDPAPEYDEAIQQAGTS